MNSDKLKGTAKDIAGKVQRKTGEMTGNTGQEIRGAAKQVEGKAHRINAPEAGLVGRHATLIAGDPTGLRVRIGDSDWSARLPRDATLPAPGAALVVEAVDGTTLVVRPL